MYPSPLHLELVSELLSCLTNLFESRDTDNAKPSEWRELCEKIELYELGGACLEETNADNSVFETLFLYPSLPAKKGVLPVTFPFLALPEFLKLLPQLASSEEAKISTSHHFLGLEMA